MRPIKVFAPHRDRQRRPGCGICGRIRAAVPMPNRLRHALEDLEARRLQAKAAKQARKAALTDLHKV